MWVNITTGAATLFLFYEALGETVCYSFNAGTVSLPFPAQTMSYAYDMRQGLLDGGDVLSVYQQNVGRYRRNLYTDAGTPSNQPTSFRVVLTNFEAMGQTESKYVYNNTPSSASAFDVPAACRESSSRAVTTTTNLGPYVLERSLGSRMVPPEIKFGVKDATNPSAEFLLHVADIERFFGRSLKYNPTVDTKTTQTLPASVDNRRFATGVRDQATCGACWAFSSVAITELVSNVKNNISGPVGVSSKWMSVQNVIDCAVGNMNGTALFPSKGCLGGWPLVGLSHIVTEGIVAETSYPFDGVNGRVCRQSQSPTPSQFPLSAAYYIPYAVKTSVNVPLLMAAIHNHGGVIAIMNANPILYYPGGIFNSPCSASLGHAVVLVGYG
eukprot:CAMPEP_0176414400 /NCGR_PEP_ID=MMETSP0127-20121128/5237_1 /TAXON_ID=938130 /ORGANISM="Platyophrya macrostoma, Strain WH" /LENGTH=382 /DNA_ID=CAMNT_0017794295 /DNA_START=253 /DNA_END=1397 /DNA_ORIENTATION=-